MFVKRQGLLVRIAYIVMGAAIFFCLAAGSVSAPYTLFKEDHAAADWSADWRTEGGEAVTIPCCSDADEPAVIRKVLPETLPADCTLLVSTSYLPVEARVDGARVEVTGTFFNGFRGLTYANARSIVHIPADAGGKTLHLTLYPTGSKMHMELHDVRLGSADMIENFCLRNGMGINLLSALLLFAAAALLAVNGVMVYRHINDHNLEIVLTALFIATSAIWFLADTDASVIRWGGSSAFLFVTLFSYLLLGLPAELLLSRLCSVGRRWLIVLAGCFAALCTGVMTAALFGVWNLALTLRISHVLYLIATISDAACVCWEAVHKKNKKLRGLAFGILALAASGCATIVNFYCFSSPDNTSYFRYGVVVFALVLALWASRLTFNNFARAHTMRRLQYAATHDQLTGLFNKTEFCRRMRELLEKNTAETFAVCCMDFEHFHLANEMFGREQGDQILRFAAERIQARIPERGLYGRMESDKFLMCIPYTKQAVDALCGALQSDAAAYPIDLALSVSFGWYIIDDRSLDVEAMADRASSARAKIKGQYLNHIAYYDAQMRTQELNEQVLVSQVDAAIADGRFLMYLQPQYDLITGRINGAEALVRWKKGNGFLAPAEFIPVFEKNGLIQRVDEYIWRKACETLHDWITVYGEESAVPISVNVSRVDLYNPNLLNLLSSIVEEYHVPPRLLPLEITESACAGNLSELTKITETFRRRGFPVHMDDFGSGYSSLNMLRDVAVDALKIDMKFLCDAEHDRKSAGILQAVANMAKVLQIRMIAEGVETEEQAALLKRIGCESTQGYYFCRPQPAAEISHLIFFGQI
jgi:diguanylate cyclase (GGDEF)-like protein